MNLVGNTIGNRYEVLEEAGIGGMATVYKAKDHVLNRDVAVKILKDEFTTDVDFIKRFNSEAQSAASLSHANIVSIYDVGHEEEDNLYYIVMELIKGKTLKQIITKDEKLSWKWALNISIQIASALEVAHKNGIVHRDIKPHNIIITEDGVAKVMDFGIAKAVSNSTMTAFGTTIGSVHYFSPEQAKGSSTDDRSDIYSLGVVMYEMLTGKVPFDADTPVSIALKHMQEDPKPAIEINENIPTAVNDIVMKAMQKEPENRYQSATEMLADLSKALKDPEGDFVILENEDGGYSRVIRGVKPADIKKSKQNNSKLNKNAKKQNIFQKYPKLKIPVAILSLVAIFFIVFGVTKIAIDGFDSSVEIPNLIGMSKEDAQKACDEKGLKFLIGEPIASNDIEKDKIAKQDPEFKNEKKIEKGTEIKVSISTGKEEHELPDWKDKTITEVKTEAEKFGLIINEIEESSDKVEKGRVISTETKAGVIVTSGDTINVHVSTGKKKTKVPSLIGITENQAKNMLTNAHLKAKVEYDTDESQPDKNGLVIKQSEEQDAEVDEGTEITITINAIDEKKTKLSVTVNATYTGTEPTASAKLTVKIDAKTAGTETVNFTAASKNKSFTITNEITKKVEITVCDEKGNSIGGPITVDPSEWYDGVETIKQEINVTIKGTSTDKKE